MRTHYDNLKIAEDAPDEVVRAAYRALSQRFHPDKNQGAANAHRIMQIINDAYGVLSDPVRRREYDEYIVRAREAARRDVPRRAPASPPTPPPRAAPVRRSLWRTIFSVLIWDLRLTLLGGVLIWAGIASLLKEQRPARPYSSSPPTSTASPPIRAKRPAFIRPFTAPNGHSWPIYASYLSGYEALATGGLSSVTVDNTKNSSDVFLKLVSLDSAVAYPVRVCFIPAYSQFVFQNVVQGRYDVRYRDLSSGGYSKTEEFSLIETRTVGGTNFSNISLTLYKVAHGNMQTEAIDESQF